MNMKVVLNSVILIVVAILFTNCYVIPCLYCNFIHEVHAHLIINFATWIKIILLGSFDQFRHILTKTILSNQASISQLKLCSSVLLGFKAIILSYLHQLNITVIWSLFGQCWNRKSLSYFAKNFDGSLKAYLPLFGGGQSQQVITTLTGECSALTLVEPRGIPKTFYIIAAIMGWHIAAYSWIYFK